MSLAIISFDAVTTADMGYLSALPNFSRLVQNGTLVTELSSVFITNTYPVHSSVITGMQPCKHGIVENLFPHADTSWPDWRCYRDSIKTTTLYDEAKKAGLKTCAVLWPVTGGAKIYKNLPEVFPKEGENQISTSLRAGSKWFQVRSLLKFGKQLDGIKQPQLDNFATSCAVEAGKRKNFDLLLLHLTDVDSHKHIYGPDSKEAREALSRMDERLGMLLDTYAGWDFILFGDHGCKSVTESVDLNKFWNEPDSYWHLAGGCAFLKTSRAPDAALLQKAAAFAEEPACHIKRALSDGEMAVSGLDSEFAFGVEAQDGFCYAQGTYKGNHGYSLLQENYTVFYLAAGKNIYKGKKTQGGSVLDIAPLGAKILGIPLWDMDGKLNLEVYDG